MTNKTNFGIYIYIYIYIYIHVYIDKICQGENILTVWHAMQPYKGGTNTVLSIGIVQPTL